MAQLRTSSRPVLRKLRYALFINLVLFALAEGSLRAAVAFGWLALPPADHTQAFDRALPEAKRLYRSDRDLIFALRPNADIVYDRTAAYPGKPAKYRVRTNEYGFRTPSFSEVKAPGVFRVVCLGDSSTFGFNVEDADAYPAVLARKLEALQPGRFEVLNLAVPGYSSRQGLELIRQQVLRYEPDLVTFGFGTNDRFWRRPLSDDKLIRLNQSTLGATVKAVQDGLDHVYVYRLLRRVLTFAMQGFVDPGQLSMAGPARVSVDEIRDNITAAEALLRPAGAALVVLNNDFFSTDAVQGIAAGAHASKAPLLDFQRLFVKKFRQRTVDIERQRRLQPPKVPKGFALFRAVALQPQQGVFIDASPLEPTSTRVAMRDDGTQGDQLPGDGIWSAYVEASDGRPFLYYYSVQTPKGVEREYAYQSLGGRDRLQSIPPNGAASIDVLGQYYLHSDASHPDEDGHALIAEQLVPVVLAQRAKQAAARRAQ